MEKRDGKFTTESVYSLGLQLISIMEQIHGAGLVFNDLKQDNILFDFDANMDKMSTSEENIFENNNINLIDFGFATQYIDEETNEHVKKQQLDVFRGNMVFASLNQMKFYTTSRRDDLISLLYFMVFLLKESNLPGIELSDDYEDPNKEFEKLYSAKHEYSSKDLCFGNSRDLYKFKKEVFSYRFADIPDYENLRNILKKLLHKEQQKSLQLSPE